MLLHDRDRRLLAGLHQYQRHRDGRGLRARVLCALGKIRYEIWSLLSACDIHRDAQIDPSVQFPHPTGVVIHRDSVVERGCMIMQQVTLGQLSTGKGPHICADVYIGAGARILGDITVGQGARIGANAVVLEDVPPQATVVGVPPAQRVLLRDDGKAT